MMISTKTQKHHLLMNTAEQARLQQGVCQSLKNSTAHFLSSHMTMAYQMNDKLLNMILHRSILN